MNAISSSARHYRSIWISDIHLGTRGCKADLLLDFLRNTESDYLYLVGDIFDIWRMRKAWYWHQTHNDVVQKILRKARKGTRVILIPGNHDESLRDFAGHRFGRVAVLREAVHKTADGRRFLVIHGDQFDAIVKYAKWLAFVGDNAYVFALKLNIWFNAARRKLGFPYWSLSQYLKHKVKNAVEYISNYETAVVAEARRRGVDGVICGHIHTPDIRPYGDIVYCNDGDWVESCTALVEERDGQLSIVRWGQEMTAWAPPGNTMNKVNTVNTVCASSSPQTLGTHRSTVSSAPSRRSSRSSPSPATTSSC